ncbi:MAG: hypothetical protein ABUK01_18540 [Leptospirales bacterium]
MKFFRIEIIIILFFAVTVGILSQQPKEDKDLPKALPEIETRVLSGVLKKREIYEFKEEETLHYYENSTGLGTDGKNYAFVVSRENGVFVNTNGKTTGPFPHYSVFKFSADYKNWLCKIIRRKGIYLGTSDKKEFGPYRAIDVIWISPEGDRWAIGNRANDETKVILSDNKVLGIYEGVVNRIYLHPDKDTYIVHATYNKEEFIYFNTEKKFGPYTPSKKNKLYFSPDGKLFALGFTGSSDYVYVDGKKNGPYEKLNFEYSPDGSDWVIEAQTIEDSFILTKTGGKIGPLYGTKGFDFSSDGNWAYVYVENGKAFIQSRFTLKKEFIFCKKYDNFTLFESIDLYSVGCLQQGIPDEKDGYYLFIRGKKFGPYKHSYSFKLLFADQGKQWALVQDTGAGSENRRNGIYNYVLINGVRAGENVFKLEQGDNGYYWFEKRENKIFLVSYTIKNNL